jgi:hypothetical protein
MKVTLFRSFQIFVQGFVVVQIPTGDPLIVFGSIAAPTNEVFDVRLADFLVVDDLVDKVFGRVVHNERSRLLQGARGPFVVVVMFEGLDVGCMEGREDVWGIWDIEGYRRGVLMHVDHEVRPNCYGSKIPSGG